jgi:hypothetical protein
MDQKVKNLSDSLSALTDDEMNALGKALDPVTSNRLQLMLRALKSSSKKTKTLSEQVQNLSEYYHEHKLDWIQFLRGYLTTHYEERGNVSIIEDRKDAFARWQSGPNEDESTVRCIVPKNGGPHRAPDKKDGYNYFQMPKWLKDSVAAKQIDPVFEKIGLHRLALIADMVVNEVDVSSIGDVEASHICGQEWCILHVRPESSSLNQERGPCFNRERDDTVICSSVIPCIRSRKASSRDGILNSEGRDTRTATENPIVGKWWNERATESGKRAEQFYSEMVKSGGKGPTGSQKMMNFVANCDDNSILSTVLKENISKKKRISEEE